MVDVEVRRPVAPDDVHLLRSVAARVAESAGHPVVGDAVWRDVEAPTTSTAIVVARDGDTVVGALHAGASEAGPEAHTVLSPAVDPTMSVADRVRLLDAALEDQRSRGGGLVELWVFGADDTWDTVARKAGLVPSRELQLLRVPLPLDDRPRWPTGTTPRTFEPDRDERAWLNVNNRAFVDDPDQGAWTEATLRRREREGWFDPAGLLLVEDGDGVAGFCWTKLHPVAPPLEPEPLGEIYVIGVDPDRQGRGLGRALVVAGLDDLHDRQGATVGMLFVDAANRPALALYRALGFRPARVDRSYTGTC